MIMFGPEVMYDERCMERLVSKNKFQGSNSHRKMTDSEGKRVLAKKRQKRDKKRKMLKRQRRRNK